ncbi:hypothetical protein KY290_010366 [Solanum tuberosum]|uniref:Uncharacterized protein n=1 Tax=Solanum tuberosum TaxID=4113 RepID=A0ABQ7VXM1_SOLTU|nr:hypothetical protein KY284_010279 [Solanum tuberosum]KAH0773229.1 hypothetical protein KY290_010366 [Solanum tuberosum]
MTKVEVRERESESEKLMDVNGIKVQNIVRDLEVDFSLNTMSLSYMNVMEIKFQWIKRDP